MRIGLMTLAVLSLLGLAPWRPADAADQPCDAYTRPGHTCQCDVRTLHPLQGALGMEEVRDKEAEIAAAPQKAWHDLRRDPIKVIRGPGDALFITDHHHGADAWRLAGRPVVLCELAARPAFSTIAEFWSGLAADRLVRLADADGHAITPAQLPASLADMPDDPYRTLAGLLRQSGGFCRSAMQRTEFAEFTWADWLRTRPELPVASVRASAASMLPIALSLARSQAAMAVPGYSGGQPPGYVCPKEK